jgi:hypothetical protein
VVAQPIRGESRVPHLPEVDSYRVQLVGLQAGLPVDLTFRTNGLRWTPSSSLRLTSTEGRFQTQASIANDALDLTGARLRLMSGYVGGAGFDYEAYGQAMADLGRSFSPASEGELHLAADLPSTDVPKGGIRQVPLLSAKVSVTRSYQWNTGSDSEYAESFHSRPERAQALYGFPNSTSQGLPESQVTVFEGDAAVGSGYLAWTPAGETALIVVPTVRGLQVRRREDSTPHPETWANTRTVKLTLDNSRSEALKVKVTEKLPYRWEDDSGGGSKRVYEFSQQPGEASKKGAFAWDVEAPAHKTAEIRYSYQEPVDLSTLRLAAFAADDSPLERKYLVEAPHTSVRQNSQRNPLRQLQPGGSMVYRFAVPADVKRAELTAWMGNAFRVSLAPEAGGKPGAYTVVADAIAISGRQVRNGETNYAGYLFDLSPFLSDTSRAVYLKIDDPTLANARGGAFIRTAEVVRIPEGFAPRAPRYPTVPPDGAGAVTPARRVLFSFSSFTEAEKPFIYEDTKTWLQDMVWPDRVRVADVDQRIVYVFTIPADVPSADCTVKVANQFVIAVAADRDGKPGPFREEINTIALLGHKVFFGENNREYTVDLTPYLKDNPARRVYVAIYDADPSDGCGAAIARVEVTALDDAERARWQTAQKLLDQYLAEEHRTVYYVLPDGGKEEAAYLYDADGSRAQALSRVVDGSSYVIYRLPVKKEDMGRSWFITVRGDFVISLAPEVNGKPGEFQPISLARDLFSEDLVQRTRNVTTKLIDVTEALVAAGACYVKIADATPEAAPGVTVMRVGLRSS